MSLHKLRLAALAALTLAVLAGAGVWAGSGSAQPPAHPADKKPEEKKPAAPVPGGKEPEKKAGTAEAAQPPVARTATEIRDALSKPFDFQGYDDPKTTLLEALEALGKICGVRFDINERAFKYEMLNDVQKTEIANPNPMPPAKTTLRHVLKKLLERVPVPSGAVFLMRKDHIEITTSQFVYDELGLRTRAGKPKEGEVQLPILPPLVWEDLNKVPLEKALRNIAKATDTNILLDPRVEKKASNEVTATLHNVPVETAVETLADMSGLAVVMRDNVIYVTSTENAERLLKSKRWFAEPQRRAQPRQPPEPGM